MAKRRGSRKVKVIEELRVANVPPLSKHRYVVEIVVETKKLYKKGYVHREVAAVLGHYLDDSLKARVRKVEFVD